MTNPSPLQVHLDALKGSFQHQRKFEAASLSELTRQLISLGARVKFEGETEQDEYFSLPKTLEISDIFLKVRTRLLSKNHLLVLQANDRKKMIPLEISDPVLARALILELGCTSVGYVTKQRDMFLWGNVNVKLDTLANGARYIEIATLYSKIEYEANARSQVQTIVDSLNLAPETESHQSYSQMFGIVA